MKHTTDSPTNEDTARLLAFLRDRDVRCPACRYNLRNLTAPVCPECQQDLELTVGIRDLRLAFFLWALVPSIFSGISACFLFAPIAISWVNNLGKPPAFVVILDAFGLLSGLFGIALVRKRHRFLGLSRAGQASIAIGTWVVHVAMTSVFFWLIFS